MKNPQEAIESITISGETIQSVCDSGIDAKGREAA